ncbi:MAG TPA: DUF4282 domain-containing protein [Pyrinomonadaceae bacterium]|nr:DUF4282 domain-containing protein [Pyrinomonadaceae bacterium]
MAGYFSFERMITPTFVKALYLVGFIAITAGGIALAVWAGMQLNDATIARSLGWRYVAAGVAAVVLGNIVWRVFCELWVVLFGIHAELTSVRHGLNLHGLRYTSEEPIEDEVIAEREEIVRPREVVVHDDDRAVPHHGILGLSR